MSNFSLRLVPLGKTIIDTRRGRPGGTNISKGISMGPKYYKIPKEIIECTLVNTSKVYPYSSLNNITREQRSS